MLVEELFKVSDIFVAFFLVVVAVYVTYDFLTK